MSTLTDTIARELGHPACTEIQESERQRVEREAADAVRLPGWFWWAVPVALVGVAVYGVIEMSGGLK